MHIQFLEAAEADLERIYGFLFDVNPRSAVKALQAISQNVRILAKNPQLGVVFSVSPVLRRWITRFGRSVYIVEYGIKDDTLTVTRLWHSREDRT